jgi:hypothetical protein
MRQLSFIERNKKVSSFVLLDCSLGDFEHHRHDSTLTIDYMTKMWPECYYIIICAKESKGISLSYIVKLQENVPTLRK